MAARKTKLLVTLFPLLLGGVALPLPPMARSAQGIPELGCNERFEEISQRSRQELDDRFRKKDNPHFVDRARDWLTEQLEVVHGRAYPAAAVEEATPLKARALALDAYGRAPEGQPFEIHALKAELAAALDRVENFGDTYKAYAEETAQKAVRLERMRELAPEVLPLTGQSARNLEFPMPYVKRTLYDEAGNFRNFELGTRIEKFANRNELLLELKGLEGSLAARMKAPLFGQSAETRVIAQQAEDLNRLGIYLSAARSVQSRVPEGTPMKGETEQLLQRIAKLYRGGDAPGRKWFDVAPEEWNPGNPVTALPLWAWRDQRWKEFWSELRSVYQKDKALTSEVLAFLNKASPEELRAAGYTSLAQDAGFWGRNKWLNVLLTGGGGGFSAWELSRRGFQYFLGDAAAKEKCAAEELEEKFAACMQSYLLEKFRGDPLRTQAIQWNKTTQEMGDRAVDFEVKDAIRRRARIRGTRAERAAAEAAFARNVREVLALEDPTSQAFRQRVVSSADEEIFRIGLLGTPEKPGLLPANFPWQYAAHQAEVHNILEETDPRQRHAKLIALRQEGAPDLTDALEKIYKEREPNTPPPTPQLSPPPPAGIPSNKPQNNAKRHKKYSN